MANQESVRDKLKRGTYETQLPFGPGRDKRAAYREDQARLQQQFKVDVLAELGITDHPKAQALWDIAWAERHPNGLREVLDFAETLSELLT